MRFHYNTLAVHVSYNTRSTCNDKGTWGVFLRDAQPLLRLYSSDFQIANANYYKDELRPRHFLTILEAHLFQISHFKFPNAAFIRFL